MLDVDTTIKPLYGEQEGAELGYNPHKVVVCCQWTPETTGLFDRRRFAAMKLGSVLVNVARGEIIDEDALAEALEQDRLRGVVLDVYKGEFQHAPSARLWQHPRVLIISGHTDESRHGGIAIFCDNLRLSRRPQTAQRHRLAAGLLTAGSESHGVG